MNMETHDETASATASSLERMVRRNEVVKTKDGRKYVAAKEHQLPDGAEVTADRPHDDGDFSYCCGSDWCRCMQ
jgi:hypothetical protein